jgi:hypothetical protein
VPLGAPPPAYGAPPPAYGAPPPAAGSGPPPSASAEQKTVMGMEAPRIAGGLAPPPAAPPHPSAHADQRTMMAQPAPNLSAQQKTMMAQEGGLASAANEPGTKIIPDSAGVVAYAAERARQARSSAQNPIVLKTPPAGPLFWLAWIVLGIGVGLGLHFFLAQRG